MKTKSIKDSFLLSKEKSGIPMMVTRSMSKDKQRSRKEQLSTHSLKKRVKEIPDFSKLHSTWQKKLDHNKAINKKTGTKVQEFQFCSKKGKTQTFVSLAEQQKEQAIEFEPDETSLKSILSNTGIQKVVVSNPAVSRAVSHAPRFSNATFNMQQKSRARPASLYSKITSDQVKPADSLKSLLPPQLSNLESKSSLITVGVPQRNSVYKKYVKLDELASIMNRTPISQRHLSMDNRSLPPPRRVKTPAKSPNCRRTPMRSPVHRFLNEIVESPVKSLQFDEEKYDDLEKMLEKDINQMEKHQLINPIKTHQSSQATPPQKPTTNTKRKSKFVTFSKENSAFSALNQKMEVLNQSLNESLSEIENFDGASKSSIKKQLKTIEKKQASLAKLKLRLEKQLLQISSPRNENKNPNETPPLPSFVTTPDRYTNIRVIAKKPVNQVRSGFHSYTPSSTHRDNTLQAKSNGLYAHNSQACVEFQDLSNSPLNLSGISPHLRACNIDRRPEATLDLEVEHYTCRQNNSPHNYFLRSENPLKSMLDTSDQCVPSVK